MLSIEAAVVSFLFLTEDLAFFVGQVVAQHHPQDRRVLHSCRPAEEGGSVELGSLAFKKLKPGFVVEPHIVNQGSIHVEDYSFEHLLQFEV